MNRRHTTVTGLGLVLALAACGGVGSGDGGEGGGSTLETMGFSLQDAIAKTRVDLAREALPDTEIKVAEGGFDEQQFLSAVASGEPPSLVYLAREDIGSYAARGALEPLGDCIESEGIDMSAFRESAVEQVTLDGEIYGIPEFTTVRVVMVDGSAQEFPGTSDWDALQQWSADNARAQGELTRIGFDPKLPEYFPLWVHANGGELVGSDGAPQLDSPEAVEALEAATAMVETSAPWSRFKAFRDTWDFFGDQNEFVTDQVAAFPMEDWYVDVLAEASPDVEIDTVPFETTDGEPITWGTGTAWAVPKDGPAAEQACTFMRVMTEADTWVAAAEASKQEREEGGGAYTGTWTANVEAEERIFSEVWEPTGSAALDGATQAIRDIQEAAFSIPASPASAEIKKAYESAVLRVLEGEQTAAESLGQAQEEAQSAWEQSGD